jgi:hypothetical protein
VLPFFSQVLKTRRSLEGESSFVNFLILGEGAR